MRILVLDDDRTRLKAFRQKLIGHDVICVETATEAIKELSWGDVFDVYFSDHDLGGKINQPSGIGTGFEVAQWLSEHQNRIPNTIIIHSFNHPGSMNIKALLPQASYIPGIWARKDIGI